LLLAHVESTALCTCMRISLSSRTT
jgi:hypothetical protein